MKTQDEIYNYLDSIKPIIEIPRSLDLFHHQTYPIINPIIEMVNRLSSPINDITQLNIGITKALLPYTATLNSFHSSILSQFADKTSAFQEAFRRSDEAHRNFIVIITKAGWAPPLDIPISFNRHCTQVYLDEGEDASKKYIDDFMIHYYTNENIETIKNHWSSIPEIENRHSILCDAITAHIAGLYNTSIPTLLTQIEGIIVQSNNHQGRISQSGLQCYIDTLLGNNDKYSPIKGLIIDEIYKNFKWGDELTKNLSRHAILHGADVSYGTLTNSLRIIILIDFLLFIMYRK